MVAHGKTVGMLNSEGFSERQLLNYSDEYGSMDGIFKAELGDGDHTVYRAVQGIRIKVDPTNQEETNLDTGVPMFSRIGDKRGSFEFDIKATYDLFEADDTGPDQSVETSTDNRNRINATDITLASKWFNDVQDDRPPTIIFVQTFHADADNKQVRLRAKLRIRDVELNREANEGVPMVPVRGDVLRVMYMAQEDRS